MVLPVGFCSAFCGVNTSAQAGIAPCLQRGSSHLVSPHSPASRVLLWRPALQPGLGLPEAPAGLSVPESLGDKHIFKGDTGAQRPLPEGGANVPPSWERTWPCAPMFRFSRGQLVCLYLSPSSAERSGGAQGRLWGQPLCLQGSRATASERQQERAERSPTLPGCSTDSAVHVCAGDPAQEPSKRLRSGPTGHTGRAISAGRPCGQAGFVPRAERREGTAGGEKPPGVTMGGRQTSESDLPALGPCAVGAGVHRSAAADRGRYLFAL